MLIDARSLRDGEYLDTDVCVIGAGAAGLVLANEFLDKDHRVTILEAGGLEPDETSQRFYKGTVLGENYSLTKSRQRCFGGTTALWGGVCMRMDPEDFLARGWIEASGWPISYQSLEPYYQRADQFLGIVDSGENYQPYKSAMADSFFNCGLLRSRPINYSAFLQFGTALLDRLKRAKNIHLLLHASVTSINVPTSTKAVRSLDVRCTNGVRFTAQSHYYVLAAGGIENPRLLLSSRHPDGCGIGNRSDLVGRYFTEHYYASAGILRVKNTTNIRTLTDGLGIHGRRIKPTFAIEGSVRRVRKLLGLNISLYNFHDAETTRGVQALKAAAKHLGVYRPSRQMPPEAIRNDDLSATFRTVMTDLPEVGRFYAWRLRQKMGLDQRDSRSALLVAGIEQMPLRTNRVALEPTSDELDMPKARLHFRFDSRTWDSFRRSMKLIADTVENAGLGFIEPVSYPGIDNKWRLGFGSHHMGTTRMNEHPKRGVVDSNCRIHGIDNLYVAGSSVFPTGGSANPTLTIVALAIRLADEIRRNLVSGRLVTPK